MRRFLPNLPSVWPIALLTFTEGMLIGANYKPGTWLMGWDNVMPEFNFLQAVRTNIFGVWIEHRGLGLPDGMGHAANLVHTLIVWLLSFALPADTLRYAFHFGMHLLGGIGAYLLLRFMLGGERRAVPFVGAFFYMLNLITVQMFFTPLEAFSMHYAALPWLAWGFLGYLKTGSRTSLLRFAGIALLTTPQFFIPTLLLPTAMLLGSIAIFRLRSWRRVLAGLCIFLAVNAFWLLPYLSNLPVNGPVIQGAKINEMSSQEIYARNRAFGDLPDVLSMKGFMLDFEDVNRDGHPIRVMDAWKTFSASPASAAGSTLIMAIALLGVLTSFRNSERERRSARLGILAAGIFAFAALANNTPGISELINLLRAHVPLLGEAYRFSFTKFSLLYAIAVTAFFAIGLESLSRMTDRLQAASRLLSACVMAFIVITISYNALPAFQGSFFYDNLRIKLPSDYMMLFKYMATRDPNGRTAYFPQPSYWSWKHYSFGYVGSGFLWYGLRQPLLDRAFDPWSNRNENYYWELSYALYSKDPAKLDAVLAKYDIRYIISDGYLLASGDDRALIPEEIAAELADIPSVRAVATFGRLKVYERDARTQSFVRTAGTLPQVPAYQWTDNDVAYRDLGDYAAGKKTEARSIAYPFRSLFTKRALDEREFTVTATQSAITLAATARNTANSLTVDTTVPVFSTSNTTVLTPQSVIPCGVLKPGTASAEEIMTPSATGLRLTSRNQRGCLSFAADSLPTADGYLTAVTWRHVQGRPLLFSLISNTAKHVEVETLLETSTPSRDGWHTSYFVLPPLAPDGLGYTVYMTNDSIGQTETVNDIGSINFYPFPYQNLVSSHSPIPETATASAAVASNPTAVVHPNPAVYTVTMPSGHTAETLILSQSYNPSWYAYDMTGLPRVARLLPFLFGKSLTGHALVNNWENGWVLPAQAQTIVIVFLPQYLEYAGFLLLISTLGWLGVRARR